MTAIVFSCFNNYDLMEYTIKNFYPQTDNIYLFVDDGSEEDEIVKGRELAENLSPNSYFIKNQGKGLQSAVSSAFDYLSKDIEWIFFPQQDVYPRGKEFFEDLNSKLQEMSECRYQGQKVGAMGFEVHCADGTFSLNKDDSPGSLGILFLSDSRKLFEMTSLVKSIKYYLLKFLGPILRGRYRYTRYRNSRRWFSEIPFKGFRKIEKNYTRDFAIELPVWVAVCLNRSIWEDKIEVDPNFIFHMWFNDVAMQMLSQNIPIMVTRDVSVVNHQSLKTLFGFNESSASAGRAGDNRHVEEYGPHLIHFAKKWGFKYEDVRTSIDLERYNGTLVERFFNHDPQNPINLIDGK